VKEFSIALISASSEKAFEVVFVLSTTVKDLVEVRRVLPS
jgi:hypothetical protein